MSDKSKQPSSLAITKTVAGLLERGDAAVVITVARGGTVGAKLLLDEAGNAVGSLGAAELDSLVVPQVAAFLQSRDETRLVRVKDDIDLLFERLQPSPRLVVCGAGHVGASLAKLGAFLGYETTLIDDRADFLQRDRFANEAIELVVASDWGSAVREVIGNGRGVSVAVVTRGHSEDEQCLRAVIDIEVDYVGMIGSKRRTKIVLERLRENGVDEERLAQVHAPVGLDIGAVTPEEVALAILAEIVAVRRGGKGGFLYLRRKTQKEP